MNRALAFAGRNAKELLRDPLSYLFCMGFPVVMLALMTVINAAIPPEANMTLFQISSLSPGNAVFGLSFVMLFGTLSVSRDRSGAFLTRLRSSPMTPADFLAGYGLPLLAVAAGQYGVNILCSLAIAGLTHAPLSFSGLLLGYVALLPIAVFLIALGILFGSLFSDKSAPPCCSILISLCGVMGGIWFDLGALPQESFLAVLCKILPFSHATNGARAAVAGDLAGMVSAIPVPALWAAAAVIGAILIFRWRLKEGK